MRPYRYKEDELVWAKVEGYPHWPATIVEIQEDGEPGKEYMVSFIGERSYTTLPYSKLAPFRQGFDSYSKKSTKALKKAITIAKEICSGRTTHEKETRKILARRQALAQKAAQTMKRLRAEGRKSLKKVAKAKKVKAIDCFATEKNYLKELLSCNDPMKVLAGRRTVERFLNSMSMEDIRINKIMESNLGIALREFYNETKNNPKLSCLKEDVGKKIEELKTGVILKLFGADDSCEMADIVRETADNIIENYTELNTNNQGYKRRRLIRNDKLVTDDIGKESNTDNEDKLDYAYNPKIEVHSFAKDTHLMIEVCEEIAQLLNKVCFEVSIVVLVYE